MSPFAAVLIFYLGVISLITVVATCLDKFFAKRDMRRISEKALFLLAVFGGSIAEYVTMRLIRHKTLHKKFMLGLPLITLLQVGFVFLLSYLSFKGTV